MESNTCKCGCGEFTNSGRTFINGHYWKGKQRSDETKKKINKALTGKHLSTEHIKKISASLKGKNSGQNNGMFGKNHPNTWKEKMSKLMMGKNNPMFGVHLSHSIETRNKISESLTGIIRSEETKRKISESRKGIVFSDEHKENLSASLSGKNNPAFWKGKHRSIDTKRKLSITGKNLWQDSDYREMIKERRTTSPNQLEMDFDAVFPELKYVGNLSFFVGSKNPDFILPGTNICIDLFGDYWHEKEEVDARINYFNRFGYDLTVIWEHEWKASREKIISKINLLTKYTIMEEN